MKYRLLLLFLITISSAYASTSDVIISVNGRNKDLKNVIEQIVDDNHIFSAFKQCSCSLEEDYNENMICFYGDLSSLLVTVESDAKDKNKKKIITHFISGEYSEYITFCINLQHCLARLTVFGTY